jgi:hypothetical protein
MYDSYSLELCTIYDSHGVYLRVLWTICMYKFSRCHVVIFHGFLFHLQFSIKIGWFPVKTARILPRRFSKKPANLSVFLVLLFLRHLRCVLAEFSWFLPIFTDFFKTRRDRWRPIFVVPLNFRTLSWRGWLPIDKASPGVIFLWFSSAHICAVLADFCSPRGLVLPVEFLLSQSTSVCSRSPNLSCSWLA